MCIQNAQLDAGEVKRVGNPQLIGMKNKEMKKRKFHLSYMCSLCSYDVIIQHTCIIPIWEPFLANSCTTV